MPPIDINTVADGLSEAVINAVDTYFALEDLGSADEEAFCQEVTDVIRDYLRRVVFPQED